MSVFNRFIISFFLLLIGINSAVSEECLLSDDMGVSYKVIVPSNSGLSVDSGYSHETSSQKAKWIDSGVFTNGDGFYFEIEGKWTPWYGNLKSVTTPTGKTISFVADKNKLCILDTKNKDAEKMEVRGEFDYITSSYNVQDNLIYYSKVNLLPKIQTSCWLTAGEGLYIAFFGKTGVSQPQVATHLKSAEVACDSRYKTDKNGDGIITLDECYDISIDSQTNKVKKSENKAYYKPYISESLIAGVRCDKDYFHKSRDDIYIGINDCYEEITADNGKISRIDRTIFTYRVPYFYKTKNKTKVGRNERVKFIIYDKYYKDNVGEYVINLYGGVDDMKDQGLIEKILTDLEKVFIGFRDDAGNLTGGVLKQFYTYIINDTIFGLMMRTLIILYMSFLGLSFAMGSLEYGTKELMSVLLKLTFILSFTTTTGWNVYDYFVVRFFFDGFSSIITMIANITSRLYESTGISGVGMSSKFAFIDTLVLFLFSDSITKKVQGLFFGVWFGFIVIPILYGLIIYYIIQLVNAVFPYIIMFIQAVLALALGPIFISLYLFKTTEYMFKNWLAFVGARFINMAFLFLFLYSFASIIRAKFMDLLYFEVCKVPIWQAVTSDPNGAINKVANFFSFGLKVWDAKWNASHPEPTFVGFCIDLFFIFILIYLFGLIMKKVPTIVDSMIDIGGESGGGLSKKGESKLGKFSNSTFTGAIDDSIKVKGEKGKDVGLIKRFGEIGRGSISNVKGYFKEQKKWKKGGELVNGIKDGIKRGTFKRDAQKSNLKGLDAVNAATADYRKYIAGEMNKNNSKFADKLDKEVEKGRANFENDIVRKPIEKELNRVLKDVKSTIQSDSNKKYNMEEIDNMVKDRMDNYIKDTMVGNSSQLSDYEKYYGNSNILSSFKSSLIGNKNFDNRGSGQLTSSANNLNTQNISNSGLIPSAGGVSTKDSRISNNLKTPEAIGKTKGIVATNDRGVANDSTIINSVEQQIGSSDGENSSEKGVDTINPYIPSIEPNEKEQTDKEDIKLSKFNSENLPTTEEELRQYAIEKSQECERIMSYALDLMPTGDYTSTNIQSKISEYRSQVFELKFGKLIDSKLSEKDLDSVRKDVENLEKERSVLFREIENKFDNSLKSDISKEPDLTKKVLDAEKDRLKKLNYTVSTSLGIGISGGKVFLGDSFDLKAAEATKQKTEILFNKMKKIEEQFKKKEKLEYATRVKEEIEKQMAILKGFKESKSEFKGEKLANIKDAKNKIESAKNLLKKECGFTFEDKDKIQKELHNITNELNKSRKEYNEGFKDIAADLKKSLNLDIETKGNLSSQEPKSSREQTQNTPQNDSIVNEVTNSIAQNTPKDAIQPPTILAVEGINAETFGVQGVKDLGIGSENIADLIGLSGASSLIMGNEFEQGHSTKDKTKETFKNESRLKVEKVKSKTLEFKLETAKKNGNEEEIRRLEEEIKETERKIKIISDDVDED